LTNREKHVLISEFTGEKTIGAKNDLKKEPIGYTQVGVFYTGSRYYEF